MFEALLILSWNTVFYFLKYTQEDKQATSLKVYIRDNVDMRICLGRFEASN